MADGVLVVLLLAFIWAAVLIPPAAGARAAREAEFLGSIRPSGHPHDPGDITGELHIVDQSRFRPALTANARRRQVLGGLVVAIGATLVLGLLPPFRLLLVVHLLLVNSCLAYVALLVHVRDGQAARNRVASRAGWASDRAGPDTGFDEPVHPYARAYASSDGFEYDEVAYPDEIAYPDEVAHQDTAAAFAGAYAYAGPDGSADGYAEAYADDRTGGYADGSASGDVSHGAGELQSDESWDEDDEAVAAYLDEELALRRPA